MSDELKDMLAKPTAPPIKVNPARDFTRQISVQRETVEAEIRAAEGLVNEGTGLEYLTEEGLNPAEWEATHFRKIKYGEGMESVKFSYRRVARLDADVPTLDSLLEIVTRAPAAPSYAPSYGSDGGLIVALGDMQFGKIDGDGPEGTLRRTLECLDKAAELAVDGNYSHVHVAWLGDHIEGFVSQGGANVARTTLPLNDQIQLVRGVMFAALERFAPMAPRVSMAAVPGNHGEPQRFAGKGITRYDDSHDTQSLIAVRDATRLNREAYGHVEFYVPETDEMTVVLDIAGTVVAHVHGHQWRPGKHFEWWRGQAFHNEGIYAADTVLAGHLHHFFVDTDGSRAFIQVPALEAESTWWRHSKGTPGDPGIVVAVTKDGRTDKLEVVRA